MAFLACVWPGYRLSDVIYVQSPNCQHGLQESLQKLSDFIVRGEVPSQISRMFISETTYSEDRIDKRRNFNLKLKLSFTKVKRIFRKKSLSQSSTDTRNGIRTVKISEIRSRVFQLILVKLHKIIYILIRQDTPLGVFRHSWTNLYAALSLRTRIINWLTVRETLRL